MNILKNPISLSEKMLEKYFKKIKRMEKALKIDNLEI